MKKMSPGTYTAFKNTTFDHCRLKFTQKKNVTQRNDEKFEKWNPGSIDDSSFSLFLTPLKAKTLLSWQMSTVTTEAY